MSPAPHVVMHYIEPESLTYAADFPGGFGIAPCGVTDRRVVLRDDGRGPHRRGFVHGTTAPTKVTCRACRRSLLRCGKVAP